ncbi:MAG: hypothetical protein ACI8UO_004535 [Verrucomicrobiales bacterium]|jgi:hypothetical protein
MMGPNCLLTNELPEASAPNFRDESDIQPPVGARGRIHTGAAQQLLARIVVAIGLRRGKMDQAWKLMRFSDK